ncbi:filamentous hemagglutinin N-terminal domain-containing protein [[Leptolyngbya] sp. PCC 7376]|uniref:two-partner secretion domain-containing protein n=1 Tax=[Leptolyngbya] sp. PCC 7376 TaxID=111781 RepID=UPI0005A20B07|nr:filamentous hemagglutinin N-terminal domain-containing protein [[Leptolyngbya] sp. PCC 7376]
MLCQCLKGDRQTLLPVLFGLFCTQAVLTAPLAAQTEIIADTTLDNPTSTFFIPDIVPSIDLYFILGGVEQGENLFHSFEKFSVPETVFALFNNAATTENIIARVTGTEISEIGGFIQTANPANLFLANPNGIEVIQGSVPNIFLGGGSFVATTATDILFPNNAVFDQNTTSLDPLLFVSAPIGLGLSETSKSIDIKGSLANLDGGATILVADGINLEGDFGIDSDISSFGGDVALVSVAGGSQVDLVDTFPIARTDTVGSDINFDFANILFRAPNPEIEQLYLFGDNLTINTFSKIALETDNVDGQGAIATFDFQGDINISDTSGLEFTNPNTGGDTNINIRAQNLTANQAFFLFKTASTTERSTINFDIAEDLVFDDLTRFNVSNGGAQGGSDIIFRANNLRVQGDTVFDIRSESSYLEANNNLPRPEVLFDITEEFTQDSSQILVDNYSATGDGADLRIETARFRMLNGSQLTNSPLRGGNGGKILINASEFLELSGRDTAQDGNILLADSNSAGNSGGVEINTGRLILRDGGIIAAGTFFDGDGGAVTINASESVELSGRSERWASGIYADLLKSSGNGKDITIRTPRLTIQDQAVITTGNFQTLNRSLEGLPAGTGKPGNINIFTQDLRLFRESLLSTNANNTDGGNINIETVTLIALDNSDITANATAGSGGRISITAQGIFGTAFRDRLTSRSDITATSDLGAEFNGVVTLNTPDVDKTSSLDKLPADITDASDQIAAACAAETGSSFALVGRGGIQENPRIALNNGTLWQDLQSYVGESNTTDIQQATRPQDIQQSIEQQPVIQPITSWQTDNAGQIQLVSQVTKSADTLSCRQHQNITS